MASLMRGALRLARALDRPRGATLAGADLRGNQYFFIPKTKEFTRESRWVEYADGGVGHTSGLAVEWQSWLTGRRKEAIPLAEQEAMAARRELLAARARGATLAAERRRFAEEAARREELKAAGVEARGALPPPQATGADQQAPQQRPLKRRSGVDPTAGAGADFEPASWKPGQ